MALFFLNNAKERRKRVSVLRTETFGVLRTPQNNNERKFRSRFTLGYKPRMFRWRCRSGVDARILYIRAPIHTRWVMV